MFNLEIESLIQTNNLGCLEEEMIAQKQKLLKKKFSLCISFGTKKTA